MITFILTVIGIFGTLAIVAYLKQVEDGMAELQEQLDTPICPVCLVPHESIAHQDSKKKKLYRSLKKTTRYYSIKRRAISRYCKLGRNK